MTVKLNEMNDVRDVRQSRKCGKTPASLELELREVISMVS